MKLNELRDNPGATRSKKRIGRGPGSGKGKMGGTGSGSRILLRFDLPGFKRLAQAEKRPTVSQLATEATESYRSAPFVKVISIRLQKCVVTVGREHTESELIITSFVLITVKITLRGNKTPHPQIDQNETMAHFNILPSTLTTQPMQPNHTACSPGVLGMLHCPLSPCCYSGSFPGTFREAKKIPQENSENRPKIK